MNISHEEIINNYTKKETPQKIIHHKYKYPYHKWILNDKGEPDDFAFEYGYHNGYACERCGYSFCEHCEPDGFEKAKTIPCIVEYYECPSCKKEIYNYKNIFYCRYCGQKIDGNNIEENSVTYIN